MWESEFMNYEQKRWIQELECWVHKQEGWFMNSNCGFMKRRLWVHEQQGWVYEQEVDSWTGRVGSWTGRVGSITEVSFYKWMGSWTWGVSLWNVNKRSIMNGFMNMRSKFMKCKQAKYNEWKSKLCFSTMFLTENLVFS